MGGFFSASSTSRSSPVVNNPVNNSDAGSVSASAYISGKGNKTVALPGGINIGRGARLNLTTTDGGAALAGLDALSDAVKTQAGLTRQAIEGFNGLAETKISDGANITSSTTKVGLYVIGGIAAVVLGFLLFRR